MRCVWGNGQDLATLKGLLCQGMLFDTELKPVGRVC